jgi:excisionase family DNA binding protein
MKWPIAPVLPSYYSPDEVAASLKVTRRTVYNWLYSGALKGAKAGVSWRITQGQLDAFLKSDAPRSVSSKGKETSAPDPAQTTIYDMGAGEDTRPGGPLKPMQQQRPSKKGGRRR